MIPEEVFTLRLEIDHSDKEPDAVNRPTIWNPEDVLRGHLKLSCDAKADLKLEKISVYFEG
jgi:hypothetical protein